MFNNLKRDNKNGFIMWFCLVRRRISHESQLLQNIRFATLEITRPHQALDHIV